MSTWLKISHHSHTGKLRPHHHTSYFPLVMIMLFVGFLLGTASHVALADTPYTGPEAGTIGLQGIVPAEPPTEGATIDIPSQGQRFTESPVTVSGTCPEGILVEIFKNDIFAGSTMCRDNGTYTIDIDLMVGENTLVAKVFDALNQPGPDSNKRTVFYDALPPQTGPLTSFDFYGEPLMLSTDAVYRGVFPGENLSVPIDIIGGTPPYAVNIQWGDTTNKVVPRDNNTPFRASHVYEKAGTYQVTFQASDADGRVAFLSVAAIVNGQPEAVTAAGPTGSGAANQLLMLWPLYAATLAVIVSFWLGEQREKRLLDHRGLLLHPQ